ncbi:hypothetical protein B0H13DRAFT_1895331 [Mycena leptocephala]|nr:hypothetical protein B0H13DRAFT_1895331 [Mycena leptocephala]
MRTLHAQRPHLSLYITVSKAPKPTPAPAPRPAPSPSAYYNAVPAPAPSLPYTPPPPMHTRPRYSSGAYPDLSLSQSGSVTPRTVYAQLSPSPTGCMPTRRLLRRPHTLPPRTRPPATATARDTRTRGSITAGGKWLKLKGLLSPETVLSSRGSQTVFRLGLYSDHSSPPNPFCRLSHGSTLQLCPPPSPRWPLLCPPPACGFHEHKVKQTIVVRGEAIINDTTVTESDARGVRASLRPLARPSSAPHFGSTTLMDINIIINGHRDVQADGLLYKPLAEIEARLLGNPTVSAVVFTGLRTDFRQFATVLFPFMPHTTSHREVCTQRALS